MRAPSIAGVGGFVAARGRRRRGGQPTQTYFSSLGAGNGPFIGDPVLPFPFPAVPYDLSITTVPANSTSQIARLDWTEPDVNSVWNKVVVGSTTGITKMWYADLDDPTTARSSAIRVLNAGGFVSEIAFAVAHPSPYGDIFFIPKCGYVWFTAVTSIIDDTLNARPVGSGIAVSGGSVVSGTITLHGHSPSPTITFVPFTTNVITGYTLYRALTKDALDTVSALTSLGHVQTYSDSELLNPIFWYRLVGHSTKFDFPFTDLGVSRMHTLTASRPQGSSITTLTWDAPQLPKATLSRTSIVIGGQQQKWKLDWTWPLTPNPSTVTLYKSSDGITFYQAVQHSFATFPNPFYDSDSSTPIYYKIICTTPDNGQSALNVVSTVGL